jgi:pSer/pThr/pTyr-binding forkhead associated (FHA) protein
MDVVLEDGEVSERHVRVTPSPDGDLLVEDLGSASGTFINHDELHGPGHLRVTGELLIGVTVLQLRSEDQIAARPTVIRTIPPALAVAPREPTYVNPAVLAADAGIAAATEHHPEIEKYLDVRVRRRTQLAPLALLLLIALALMIYFATR